MDFTPADHGLVDAWNQLLARRQHLRFRSSKTAHIEAVLCILACFLAIPLLPMGFLFFTEIPAAFLPFQCYRWMSEPGSAKRIVAALAGAFLPFLHIKYCLLSGVLFGYSLKYWRHAIFIYLTAALLFLSLNYYLWGNILPYAAYGGNPLSISALGEGILGLFIDQEFGLLFYSPLYLLTLAGWFITLREDRQEGLMLLFLMLSTILVSAAYPMWWGGWSPAARFLTPAVIFMVPLVVRGISRLWTSRWGRAAAIPFLAFQFAMALLLWQKPRFMWNYAYGESDLYHWLINGYTYYLPSLISVSPEDLLPCGLWSTIALIISIGLMKLSKHAAP